jgi:small basic protein
MNIFSTIWPVAIGLLLLIAANIMIASCDAWISGQFDAKTFFKGVVKGLVIAACAVLAYLAGYLNPDIYITFGGQQVTLTSAMTIFMIAAYSAYALKILQKLYALFKLDSSGGEAAAIDLTATAEDTGSTAAAAEAPSVTSQEASMDNTAA